MVTESDALWLSIVAGLLFLAWGYHLVRSILLWRRERSIRAFRGLFIAVMLQVGLLRIWVGTTARAVGDDPILGVLTAISGPLLSLLLLSGAIVIAVSWHRTP